jgi:hypothetical protein
VRIGLHVDVTRAGGKQRGVVRFVGPTDFSPTGTWIGVELDAAEGKHDGSVAGRRYFQCSDGAGLFVRPNKAKPLSAAATATADGGLRLPAIGGSGVAAVSAARGSRRVGSASAGGAREAARAGVRQAAARGGRSRSAGTGSGSGTGGSRAARNEAPRRMAQPRRERVRGAAGGAALPGGAAAAATSRFEESEARRRARERADADERALDRAREAALLQLDMLGRQQPALPWEQGGGRGDMTTFTVSSPMAFGMPELEAGDKVVLPPSLLERLLRTSANLQTMLDPMLFKLSLPTVDVGSGAAPSGGVRDSKHVGVLEFNAPEGVAVVPTWIANSLGITPDEGQKVCVERKSLPKGTFAKLQPLTTAFAERIEQPKEALEEFLSSHYATLSKGDTIRLDTGVEIFELQVLETKPSDDGVLIIDTDLEVDFAPAAIGGETQQAMAMGMGAEQAMSPTTQQAAAAAADSDRRAAARAARAAKIAAENGGGAAAAAPTPAAAAASSTAAATAQAPAVAAARAPAAQPVPAESTELTQSRAAVESLLSGHQSRTVAALGSGAAVTASVNGDDPDLQRAIAESMAVAAAAQLPPLEVDEDEQLAAAIAASLASHAQEPPPPASKDLFTSSVAARAVEAIEEAVALESANPMMMMAESEDDEAGGGLTGAHSHPPSSIATAGAGAMAAPAAAAAAALPDLTAAPVPEEVNAAPSSGSGSGSDAGSVPEEVVNVDGAGNQLKPATPGQEAEPSAEELRRLRMARFG